LTLLALGLRALVIREAVIGWLALDLPAVSITTQDYGEVILQSPAAFRRTAGLLPH
jgi:hypothetical protein